MAQITYEVLVLQAGKWTIESRYNKLEREAAIADAKSMHENPHVVAVKVVKETYDEETNSNYESTVFSTEAAKPTVGETSKFADMEVDVGGPDFADMSFGADGFEDDGYVAEPRKKSKKQKQARPSGRNPIAMIFIKILVITTVSLAFAFVATFLFGELIL